MRNLLPVSENEKLVARGKYTCYRYGYHGGDFSIYKGPENNVIKLEPVEGIADLYRALIPSGVVEFWTIHELPDKSQVIRCDRQADHADSGMQVMAYMMNSATGQTRKMEMQVHAEVLPDDIELAAEATYIFHDDHVQITHRALVARDTMSEQTQTDMDLPPGYKVDFGRMTISKGFIIRDSADQSQAEETIGNFISIPKSDESYDPFANGVPVFSPYNPGGYAFLFHTEHILKGEIEYYSTNKIASDTRYKTGHVETTGDEYRLVIHNKHIGFGYSVLVDQYGIMLSDGMEYIYYLTEYEHMGTDNAPSR